MLLVNIDIELSSGLKEKQKMDYIKPDNVTSPRKNWSLIAVLDEGTEGSSALALGTWKGQPRLGMRWNGRSDNPVGNPQSRGLPTWFMLDEKYQQAILQSGLLAPDKVILARHFFPK